MLFDTINEQLELGPASQLASGTTAGSGNTGYTMKGTATSWSSFVQAGDLVVIDPTGTPASAHVLEVVSNTELTLDAAIADNNTDFEILRPTEAFIQPQQEWQWEIHSIVASRRQIAEAEDFGVWPVEVWATDDSYPRTLLLTSTADDGFVHTDLLLKPTYFNWLLIRNYQKVRVDIAMNGIDKTIVHE